MFLKHLNNPHNDTKITMKIEYHDSLRFLDVLLSQLLSMLVWSFSLSKITTIDICEHNPDRIKKFLLKCKVEPNFKYLSKTSHLLPTP